MTDKAKIVKVCHLVYQKGFVSAYDGNVSKITTNNTILITRSGVCKGDVTEDDILEIDFAGNILNGKGRISTEYKIHLYAYAKRHNVNAVVHCHPTYATAFAATGGSLTENVFPEVILTLGKVPLCKYATPSTDELALSMEPYIDFAWAFLLENHGAVTLGKTLFDAYYKMEKLEHTAKILFAARQLGGAKKLSPDQLATLFSIAKDVYGIEPHKKNFL